MNWDNTYGMTKYIVINYMGKELGVIFSNEAVHRDVATALGGSRMVVGAGFLRQMPDGEVICGGESLSLDVKSRGEADEKVLNAMLRGWQ